MFVYVINQNGIPLMPCKPAKAKHLLKAGKAKVVKRSPFTIKLLWDCENNIQPIIAGMDSGSKIVGCAAITNGKVIYQAEVQLRQDVSKKLKQRSMYRRSRRSRKLRYRPVRYLNRSNSCRKDRIVPSLKSKIESHLREKKQVEQLLPITEWRVETASFDIHKITNPNIYEIGYKNGPQKNYYNLKAYIISRDNHKCQSGQNIEHSENLHVHHIKFKSNGGTDTPNNLITLCKTCHNNLHLGKFTLKTVVINKTKHATEIGIIKSQLKKNWNFKECFGYETKFKREQILKLPKSHFNDSVAICCDEDEWVLPLPVVLQKKHVSKGDFQQFKGKRSEKKIPTRKLFGLRKFDLIQTSKGTGFVKGKRNTGHFALMDIFSNTIVSSVNIKKDCKRLKSRTTTLIGGWQIAIKK